MKKIGFLLIILTILISGASPKRRLPDASYYAEQNNKFAFELYKKITENTTGNIFMSPFSISSALALTYAGANGPTEKEMSTALFFDQNEPFFHYGYGAYATQLLTNAQANVELAIANQLWGEKTYPLQEDFVRINKQAYHAELISMDFIHSPNKERLVINNWVASQTKNRIQDLLPAGSVDTDSRLVLTNAIYFKGDWLTKFDQKKTRERLFKKTETDAKKIAFMHAWADLRYYENNDFQMVNLPYKGDQQSMVVVLPKDPQHMSLVADQMNTGQLAKGVMAPKVKVNLAFPKFKLTRNLELNNYLKEMGMKSAFQKGADFSKMTSLNDLWISGVVHKAFIEIDEKGSEAAAATAVVMTTESLAPSRVPEPKVFVADHPFLIYIIDNETKAILFMGRITDPVAA